jgi:hypothetical protein
MSDRPSHLQIPTKRVGKLDLARRPALHSKKCRACDKNGYVTFFFVAFSFSHLFRCAAAIFLRAEADRVRLGLV